MKRFYSAKKKKKKKGPWKRYLQISLRFFSGIIWKNQSRVIEFRDKRSNGGGNERENERLTMAALESLEDDTGAWKYTSSYRRR